MTGRGTASSQALSEAHGCPALGGGGNGSEGVWPELPGKEKSRQRREGQRLGVLVGSRHPPRYPFPGPGPSPAHPARVAFWGRGAEQPQQPGSSRPHLHGSPPTEGRAGQGKVALCAFLKKKNL